MCNTPRFVGRELLCTQDTSFAKTIFSDGNVLEAVYSKRIGLREYLV